MELANSLAPSLCCVGSRDCNISIATWTLPSCSLSMFEGVGWNAAGDGVRLLTKGEGCVWNPTPLPRRLSVPILRCRTGADWGLRSLPLPPGLEANLFGESSPSVRGKIHRALAGTGGRAECGHAPCVWLKYASKSLETPPPLLRGVLTLFLDLLGVRGVRYKTCLSMVLLKVSVSMGYSPPSAAPRSSASCNQVLSNMYIKNMRPPRPVLLIFGVWTWSGWGTCSSACLMRRVRTIFPNISCSTSSKSSSLK